MKIDKECPSITEVLEDAIHKEAEFQEYLRTCAKEIGDPKVKDYLEKLSKEEADHKEKLAGYLEEVKAQIEIDEAIMESYDHL